MFEDRVRYSIKCGQFSFAPPSSPERALSELRDIRLRCTRIEKLERIDDRNMVEIVVFSTDLMSSQLDPVDLSMLLIPVSHNRGKVYSITAVDPEIAKTE
jgi:hypothetical protein